MEEFIIFCDGDMTFQEYSLKFTKLSKYDPSLLSNVIVDISLLMMSVPDDLVEEFYLTMLHEIICTFVVSWCMLKKLKILGLGTRLMMSRGQDLMMEVLLTVRLRFTISQGLRGGFLTRILQMIQG